ncbi:MAG: hypothetical protein B7Y25_04405 [Alphaproteobacteria bacterium 16-39-46]|nr:MAG: hypothetical protein B7Y25_04405 [Alphaproteobacteria bacterium 16-39-46]OZA43020.1 MAG: hypothetical protein B7X84_04325 [Alphaproteobacteria bacterium 17-39-52]
MFLSGLSMFFSKKRLKEVAIFDFLRSSSPKGLKSPFIAAIMFHRGFKKLFLLCFCLNKQKKDVQKRK